MPCVPVSSLLDFDLIFSLNEVSNPGLVSASYMRLHVYIPSI